MKNLNNLTVSDSDIAEHVLRPNDDTVPIRIGPQGKGREYKQDHRPPKSGWADGDYMNFCLVCHCGFVGDKRAVMCADCAYDPK